MIFRAYPILRYLIFLVLGILLYERFTLTYAELGALFVFFTGTGLISTINKSFYKFRWVLLFSFLILGFFSAKLFNDREKYHHFSHFDLNLPVRLEIASYTETKEKTYKVLAEIKAIKNQDNWVPASGKTLLYFNQEAGVFPKFGEWYEISNGLQEIAAPKNEYEFNYKRYLSRRNVYNQQFLRAGDFVKLGENPNKSIFYYANLANNYTHEVFSSVLDNSDQLGVAEAIIGGMRSELTRETLDWYTKTGTVHALAVSGLHVGIFFLVLNFVFRLFLNPKKLPYLVAVLLFLWSYAIFTGLSPSVSRATLMFSIFQIGIFIQRGANPINTLLFSALVLLIFKPYWIYEVGFQLSYLAVFGILVLYPWLSKQIEVKQPVLRWFWQITAVSIAAQIYTLPLVLYYFQQIPNYTLLANPWVSLICIPLLPTGFLTLVLYKVPIAGTILGFIFKWLIIIMNGVVYWVSSLPYSLTEGIALSLIGVMILFVAIAFSQYYLNSLQVRYLKYFFLVFIIGSGVAIFKRLKQYHQNEIAFHYIPGGQGISFIQGRSSLFMSSDSLIKEPQTKQYQLKNYYNALGIKQYDIKSVDLEQNEQIETEMGSILWLKNRENIPESLDSDFILISNNALPADLEVRTNHLILDGSNSKNYSRKIKEIYPDVVILYDTGTKIYKGL